MPSNLYPPCFFIKRAGLFHCQGTWLLPTPLREFRPGAAGPSSGLEYGFLGDFVPDNLGEFAGFCLVRAE